MALWPNAFQLLRGARVLAPDDRGPRDVLLIGSQIGALLPPGSRPPASEGWPALVEHNLTGLTLVPGLVDGHEHLTGGGGEGGPTTRTPEVALSMLTRAGVTTVVGCLGTDGTTRSMEALLAKAMALAQEGLTTAIWTGAYEVPPPTLTGSVRRDIILIEKVIGCGEIAVSDHRSAQPTYEQLRHLAAECRVGGMLGGKPGILHLHVGPGPRGIDDVLAIIAEGEIPASQFLPTHMGRNARLVSQAAELTRIGGRVDFTAGDSCAARVAECIAAGADSGRISISSDGGGSLPRFAADGSLAGLAVGTPATLLETCRDLVRNQGIQPVTALSMITRNPARALGFGSCKGMVAPGMEADLVAVDQDWQVRYVWARGRQMIADGVPLVLGTFE